MGFKEEHSSKSGVNFMGKRETVGKGEKKNFARGGAAAPRRILLDFKHQPLTNTLFW